ncbi:hypothetical protein F5B18DRAFT_653394 [Nemania serpens]|nr:hypothetical protein F5B18DRAFT_653394 [Nemania serpens]
MALIDNSIEDMRTSLPATVTKISIRHAWEDTRSSGLPQNVDEYLKDLSHPPGRECSAKLCGVVSPLSEDQAVLYELFVPSILGSPDIAVPIADIQYASRITHKVEYLPVVADAVGAPGTHF